MLQETEMLADLSNGKSSQIGPSDKSLNEEGGTREKNAEIGQIRMLNLRKVKKYKR